MKMHVLMIKRDYDNPVLIEELLEKTTEESLLGKIIRIKSLMDAKKPESPTPKTETWWKPEFDYKFGGKL